MIKKTLYFGNPCYLSIKLKQLHIAFAGDDTQEPVMLAVEDVGVVVIDNNQITITSGVLQSLLDNNTAIIACDHKHMPAGLFMPLSANTLQQERFDAQIKASLPLKKQLWQQTIMAKIKNQAAHLKLLGKKADNMLHWAASVKAGDAQNHEARAAAYYWSCLFDNVEEFRRGREGEAPNNFLNYGYALLRATVARSLVSSGLLPTLGIYHHNRYNAYALADDIMEPYRPYVDRMVWLIMESAPSCDELTKEVKQILLNIPAMDVFIDGQKSPLMIGVQRTTASLAKCFAGETRKIIYPDF